jgi:dihydrofolate reductase
LSIILVAAIDRNFAIGHKGNLLSKQSEDLKHFKKLTQDKFVVMGRKTYESIGHPLPNRHNIVISSKAHKLDYHPEVSLFSSVSEVMAHYEDYAERKIDLYIIGVELFMSNSYLFVTRCT